MCDLRELETIYFFKENKYIDDRHINYIHHKDYWNLMSEMKSTMGWYQPTHCTGSAPYFWVNGMKKNEYNWHYPDRDADYVRYDINQDLYYCWGSPLITKEELFHKLAQEGIVE